MKEHRVIEKIISLIEKRRAYIKRTMKIDVNFVDTTVNFIMARSIYELAVVE